MTVHFVVPDPAVPSGGNAYDRRAGHALGLARTVLPGPWPHPDGAARAALAQLLTDYPDGDVVLLDGLIACAVPDLLQPHADRLRLAVLVHLPLADETGLDPSTAARLAAAERRSLHLAHAVVATSPAAARDLAARHGLPRVHVAEPGVDPEDLAEGTDGVSRLLCVASVTPRKGHDLLIRALAAAPGPWRLRCVGPLPPTPHTEHVRALSRDLPVHWLGPRTGEALAAEYRAADLFVLASHTETYGMVVTEALARGLPVLASAVPDALGEGGLLLPPGDLAAWTAALRRWCTDPELRHDLRTAARARRARLSTWDTTARQLGEVLATLRA
ncbi:glycosyltransferase involved in cell wall biosynthesis [Crossiella equi]|uniref:Glycosyltransferase involved in cell wall biosynthesis n=1 Tax=Crossiella equi TaxID=130796 RepID=A0ABS5AQ89_9PSEU|nr:glycosyltransferase family 4 protein [Crossiella equi]MBP2478715.1 glycosyltransferase involved in cell wall biosynthesis [Crossiella equi]